MKNLTLTLVLSPMFVFAQPLASSGSKHFNTPITASNITQSPDYETPEQARMLLMNSFNLYRGFSISVEELSTEKEEKTVEEDKKDFNAYLTKMEQVLQRRLKEVETDDIKDSEQLAEKSDFIRALTILKSAHCLADRQNGSFVRQKDLTSRNIIAYQLDELRSNARYGFVEAYNEGFARIKKDQVFGFLNYCGEEIIPCQYETAEAFNNGRALVKKANWYFVDAKGQESDVLQNVADAKAIRYGISLAQFKNGKYAFIDNRYDVTKAPLSSYYDEIIPFFGKDIFRVRHNGRYGLISLQGVVKLDAQYENIDISNISHLYKVTQNAKLGLVDTFWRVKFTPAYDLIGDFNDKGLAVVKEGEKYRVLSGRTYKSSQLYKSIGTFDKNGMAQIQDASGNYGVINTDLQETVPTQYFSIGEFNDLGLASACRYDKKCGFINMKGVEVISPVYEEVEPFNKYGLVVVREATKEGNKTKMVKTDLIYNKNGQVVIAKANEKEVSSMKIRYELMDSLHSERYVAVKMSIDDAMQGFHLIEANTYKLITATPYNTITPADINGLLRVKKGEFWGLIDTIGRIVLSPTYSEIRKQTEGFYPVKNENDKFGFIDKKAKIQIPFEYEDVKSFRKGHCIVARGKEKWGLINKFNAKIVPLNFKSVNTKDGQYEMMDNKDVIYVIDDKGDCLQNCQKFEQLRRKANE
jgi:WG containing repeat